MNKDQSIEMRDRLESMSNDIMAGNPGTEDHVIACCLAVAMEELEKWIYDGGWAPSVRPYIDNRKFEIPIDPETADDEKFQGPPWAREKKQEPKFEDKYPTVARLKREGRLVQPQTLSLDKYKMLDWEAPLMEAFRNGEWGVCSRNLRLITAAPVRKIKEYLDRKKASYPVLWGIDKKPGDKCPDCRHTVIHLSDTPGDREFRCMDCGTQWGFKNGW